MSFFNEAKRASSVLVLDLGFLGDSVHLIPALQCISRNLPGAQIDVMLSDHIKDVLCFTPGIREVIGYPRFPKGPKWYQHGPWLKLFRQKKYDLVINLNGSSRSSYLTWFTRARFRLGRGDENQAFHVRFCHTDVVLTNRHNQAIYKQNLQCLTEAGFPEGNYPFVQEISESEIKKCTGEFQLPDRFIHISPFTNNDYKEMPKGYLVNILNKFHLEEDIPLVVSCANTEREKNKMADFLKGLSFNPTLVLDGKVNIKQLIAIIHKSILHLGGDSGALHIARMTNTPTFSWFRNYDGIKAWLPEGDLDQTLIGEVSPEGILGIDPKDFLTKLLKQVGDLD